MNFYETPMGSSIRQSVWQWCRRACPLLGWFTEEAPLVVLPVAWRRECDGLGLLLRACQARVDVCGAHYELGCLHKCTRRHPHGAFFNKITRRSILRRTLPTSSRRKTLLFCRGRLEVLIVTLWNIRALCVRKWSPVWSYRWPERIFRLRMG